MTVYMIFKYSKRFRFVPLFNKVKDVDCGIMHLLYRFQQINIVSPQISHAKICFPFELHRCEDVWANFALPTLWTSYAYSKDSTISSLLLGAYLIFK